MKIVLDAMGGDLAPKAVIEGAVAAARELGIEIILVGNRDQIAKELADHDHRGLPLTVEHAPETVAMDDSPLESVLTKPESSLHVGLELVKQGTADGFVSAGNSGAMMATAMAILGTLPGVDRPAIASLVPTTEGFALLIDAGANTDVKPLNLMQFGVMGSVYWSRVQGVLRPRVGLLANGEEASKGTDLTRDAAVALAQMTPHINYIGYIEGHDINRAVADVVVTDGFTGNVALKTMEGFAAFMLGNLREVFSHGPMRRIAFLLIRRHLGAMRQRLDPAEYGGAPLLGVNGVVVIAHGSSSGRAIRNAIRAAANEALVRKVNAEIVEILAQSPPALIAKPSNKGIRGIFLKMRDRLHLNRENPERKPDRPERPDKIDRPDRLERPERSEKPEKSDKSDRPGEANHHAALEGAEITRAAVPNGKLPTENASQNGTPTPAGAIRPVAESAPDNDNRPAAASPEPDRDEAQAAAVPLPNH